jgi:hypothetical protein
MRLGEQSLVDLSRGLTAEAFLGRPGEVGKLYLHKSLPDFSLRGLLTQLSDQLVGEFRNGSQALLQRIKVVAEGGLIA